MRIERFHIQGFKSLVDVTVDGLAEINVFFGLNDVGKSNIFQALKLWHWALSTMSSPNDEVPYENLRQHFGQLVFHVHGKEIIQLTVDIVLFRSKVSNLNRGQKLVSQVLSKFDSLDASELHVSSTVVLEKQNDKIQLRANQSWEGGGNFGLHPGDLAKVLQQFHIIGATRRFVTEQRADKPLGFVTEQNIKKALFYAYLSSDLRQKQRLAAIREILAEPPFALGELDVALDPATDEIDIGFVRSEGRLPLENLGSGAQQLLLILGQVFLNDASIVVLEEPEMNLSPQYQESLMLALRTLMQDPAVQLEQLFISTHSPYLEFAENFYDVTMDADGATHIARATASDHASHFAVTPVGPENGARLNSLNQVTLYDRLIEDLGLQRGDLVIFAPNEQGRWEVRSGKEVAEDLEKLAASNGR